MGYISRILTTSAINFSSCYLASQVNGSATHILLTLPFLPRYNCPKILIDPPGFYRFSLSKTTSTVGASVIIKNCCVQVHTKNIAKYNLQFQQNNSWGCNQCNTLLIVTTATSLVVLLKCGYNVITFSTKIMSFISTKISGMYQKKYTSLQHPV